MLSAQAPKKYGTLEYPPSFGIQVREVERSSNAQGQSHLQPCGTQAGLTLPIFDTE